MLKDWKLPKGPLKTRALFKTSSVWRQRAFWPELRRSPAGSDPSQNHSEEPAAARSCTMWPQALEHHELHMTGWLRSQLVAWPCLMQRLDGASGWDRLMVCTCRKGMILAWFTIDKMCQSWHLANCFLLFVVQCLMIELFLSEVELCTQDTMCLLTINTEQNTLLVLTCWVGSCAYILPSILQSCLRQLQHLATFNIYKNTRCNICVGNFT